MFLKIARVAVSATRNYSSSLKNVLKSKKNYQTASTFYDKMIAIGSLGQRRSWLEKLISQLPIENGTRILDMAGGQGAVTFTFLERVRRLGAEGCVSYVCDISDEMMAIGNNKALQLGLPADAVKWVHGDIHQLPFDDAFFNECVLFYGIRKIDLARVFDEAHRVLKPGGHFFVFDVNRSENPIVDWLYWKFYVMRVLPRLIRVSSPDQIATYNSVVDDITNMPPKDEMVSLLKTANFKEIKYADHQFGIAQRYICLKV